MSKENRMCIRVELSQSFGMNFVSPFQPEKEFKVYNSWKCQNVKKISEFEFERYHRISDFFILQEMFRYVI